MNVRIFEKLSKEKELENDDYIKQYSKEFIGVERNGFEDLSEIEGDLWIHKAYLYILVTHLLRA